MLDSSPKKILEWREEYGLEILQLASPLTRYKNHDKIQFGYDNGAFTINPFSNPHWKPVEMSMKPNCKWVVMPDVVGCALATNRLFHLMKDNIELSRRAIVAQDGHGVLEKYDVPFDEIGCLFIGGSTHWKDSQGVILAAYCKEHYPHVWIHVGRVNTMRRISLFFDVANSFDGSGLVRFGMLEELIPRIKQLQNSNQLSLKEWLK